MRINHDTHDSFLYGGTGVGKIVHWVAVIYYQELALAAGGAHIVSLAFAGLLHPVLRHRHAKEVRDHKSRLIRKLLFLLGHSQGAIEALWQAMQSVIRNERPVEAVICLAGPFDGAPLASIVKFLEHLPSWLRYVFDGILEMVQGSKQLERLQELVRIAASIPDAHLPHIYLIAAAHDGLVPLDSAWRLAAEYPASLVHRCLLLGGDGPPPEDLPEGVIIIRTNWGMDNHLTMIGSRELQAYIEQIVWENHQVGESDVEVVVGSV